MPETSGGRSGSRGVCSSSRVSASTFSGSPPVGSPAIGRSRHCHSARPPDSVRVATADTPTKEYRDHTPPSADSSRKVFGPVAAQLVVEPHRR